MSTTSHSGGYDILSVDAVEERFGIEICLYEQDSGTAHMRMPISVWRNQLTGAATIGPLPLLVDDSGSTVAYALRGDGWPVTSELNIQLRHDALATLERSAGDYLQSQVHAVDVNHHGALAACRLTVGDNLIGTATVRAVFINGGLLDYLQPSETLTNKSERSLAELMAATAAPTDDGTQILMQRPDPMIFNASSNVHGGVAAMGLEIVGSAAILDACGPGYWTGSLQVNYPRPFVAGPTSRYVGELMRRGSTVAVAEAQALGDNGKTAVTARLTAYREL
ncbi:MULTISPECIES: PaaI family thioesterase [unclassified Mycolicibacterium]|uniref:PaaI family thioesterase n=2 Tax=Mycolicibacterium TaxID=1866885 RepID=UPI0012DFC186|nr:MULTISPECIES: PaaI family thioesterase [unclassified Mycolicibacterium]MUL49430.1 PaaI family thioesterase [Mycolicibacterium sp. CBMA 360]MUL57208.1 PaaI family thioesterase [Mycolicibacterium sp. CBMA 335]MUL70248.1 PaaI family thioesterase [Mycolicibacterium sp. CBMA 311]MUL92296.1 PaaI family thioesterase [Mycolicibacterium sp. CBMA 230]